MNFFVIRNNYTGKFFVGTGGQGGGSTGSDYRKGGPKMYMTLGSAKTALSNVASWYGNNNDHDTEFEILPVELVLGDAVHKVTVKPS